ncbi:MAG: putative DNA-binding domain-containing protein, partial [Pseudomonadota bacterium]
MAELPEFQRRQYEFAAHIRDPENNPAPAGVEDRRMAIYRDLFIGNLASLLAATYPVLRRFYDKPGWRRLIRGFMRGHRAHTPLFLEVPDEFLDYLTDEHEDSEDDPPFLRELAHYEWVELKLSVAPDPEPDPGVDPDGDLLDGRPVL